MLVILTQAEIVEKVGSSAAEVFAGFYEQYLPKVFRYINYRVTDISLAEDLTSAVFEKALTKFKTYSSDKANFSTWIFTIARNTLIDHYRVNSKTQMVRAEDPAALAVQSDSPEDAGERAEEIQLLNSCLAELSQPEREIISLKFGAEMTNREIAKMLALTESNVGIIIFRAVRKLRDNFRGRLNG